MGLFTASVNAALGIFLVYLFVFLLGNTGGWPLRACLGGVGLFVLTTAVFQVRAALRTPRHWVAGELPPEMPELEKIRVYRRMMVLGSIACVVLSVLAAIDLHSLETGEKDRVMTDVLTGTVYETIGYWPAVIAPLALGAAIVARLMLKIRKLQNQRDPPSHPSSGK